MAILLTLVPLRVGAIDAGPEFILPSSQLAPLRLAPWWDEFLYGGPTYYQDGRVEVSRCGENYLVVWGGLDHAVYGARLTPSGDMIDASPLLISASGASPAVASNGESCLVVWMSPDMPTSILGLRLTPEGRSLDAAPFVIAQGYPRYVDSGDGPQLYEPGEFIHPGVATDGTDYLVTYWSNSDLVPWVEARIVTRNADVLAPFEVVHSDDARLYPIRTSFAHNGELYLVAFQEFEGADQGISKWCYTVPTVTSPVCRVMFFVANELTPIATASDGANFLVLLTRSGVRAVWIPATLDEVPQLVPIDSSSEMLDEFATPLWTGTVPAVGVYEGKQYLAIWPNELQTFGALLPRSFGGAAATKEPLFPAGYTAPALASFGKGTSLLLYAAASSTDPAVKEVRGRVIVTDDTPPTLVVPSAISATATTSTGVVVAFEPSATDDYSGPLQPACLPASGSVFSPGTTHVQCVAFDAAGNMGAASFDVAVTFSWSGIMQPINADGSSVFKVGRTVPVKFRLTGASAGIAGLAPRLLLSKMSDGVTGTEEEAGSASAADTGNTFRYDAAAGQYVFNLATGSLSPGTWRLRIDLHDGVERAVLVSLKP